MLTERLRWEGFLPRWSLFPAAVALTVAASAAPVLADDDLQACRQAQGDIAIAACTRAIKSGKYKGADLGVAFYNRAWRHAAKGDRTLALTDYNLAIQSNPKDGALYRARGTLLYNQEQYDRAISDYNVAIKLKPNDPDSYYGRGVSWRAKGDHERAIADLTNAVIFNPNDYEAFLSRGRSFADRLEYSSAIADYTAAINLKPGVPNPYYERGLARYQLGGQDDLAVVDYNEAIRLNPTYAQAYCGRGVVLARMGDREAAIADLGQAIKLDPGYVTAFAARGLEHEGKGDVASARADLEKALSLPPRSGTEYWTGKARERLAALKDGARSSQPAPRRDSPDGYAFKSEQPRTDDERSLAALFQRGRRYALVIGNKNYKDAAFYRPLATPHADAKGIAEVLTSLYGFTTEIVGPDGGRRSLLLLDSTGNEIKRTLDILASILAPDDQLIIYYAGHGTYDKETDTAYWVPVDADRAYASDLIPAADITRSFQRMKARSILVISDSCYSGMLGRERSAPPPDAYRDTTLFKLAQDKSRVVVSSGGNEPVLDGGGSGHSIFAYHLLRLLRSSQGAFSTTDLVYRKKLQELVAGSPNADQTPYRDVLRRSGHEGGDFVFLRVPGQASQAAK